MIQSQILTVSELNSKVHSLLQTGLDSFWITGEISNFSMPRSGHWYFSIKDPKSQVRCAMFSQANKLVKFIPKDGIKVNMIAKASLYGARGDFQLIVSAMVDDGIGKLQQEFQFLLRKLSAQGLFDKENKKTLPHIPKSIAIITSPTGAAIHDILNVLSRRNTLSPIKLYPTMVQGNLAHNEIISAIKACNQDNICDVIILARGGGSIEDLWPFNNEELAYSIFSSKVPIITGIGHETDFTIADYVADHRAPTPSAAAEIVCIDSKQLLERLNLARTQLVHFIISKIDSLRSRLYYARAKLPDPVNHINLLCERTASYKNLILKSMQNKLQMKLSKIRELSGQLHALSPLATLARGYNIAIDKSSNKAITSVKSISVGSKIKLILQSGELHATVDNIMETSAEEEKECRSKNL